jgi:hypothetical protein
MNIKIQNTISLCGCEDEEITLATGFEDAFLGIASQFNRRFAVRCLVFTGYDAIKNIIGERDRLRQLLVADSERVDAYLGVCTERDEAREQIKELIYIAGRAIDLADLDFENDKFGVVSELRGGLEKIKEETK